MISTLMEVETIAIHIGNMRSKSAEPDIHMWYPCWMTVEPRKALL